MPRFPRGPGEGLIHHILNRGNARATVFHDREDYEAFLRLLGEAKRKYEVAVYAFALMPNHFHLVAREESGATTGTLSAFMQWWMTSFVRRQHQIRGSSGHLWQGRFKSFPIQEDEHLLTVLRYVLRNPLRARLATSATEWPWTSLRYNGLISPWPIAPPQDLQSWVSYEPPRAETEAIRLSVHKRSPYGAPEWQSAVSERLGLAAAMRAVGRPRREESAVSLGV